MTRQTAMLANFILFSLASTAFGGPSPITDRYGDISILAADDLITNDTTKTSAAVLVSAKSKLSSAYEACGALGENLWSPKRQDFRAGLNYSLAYEVYSGRVSSNQLFWIDSESQPAVHHYEALCEAIDATGKVHRVSCHESLPALCTQSAPASNSTFADTSARFQVAQPVGQQTLIGYRDFLTFRFMGVRFAKEPERFTYSKLYDGTGTNSALNPAPECLQPPNNGSTDCLFLNLYTTHLPSERSPVKQQLKPVMVYIYGGGFTTGSASNPTNDGGNTAARGDVVMVDLAYRLGTLGFLAFEDGVHNGNYWLSDCIAGLQWVQKYISRFGGDPNRVTIYGESAGAVSVAALIASPEAKGLFHGAIIQSLYLEPYLPISQSVNQSTIPILQETGCDSAKDQLACLQGYNATALISGLKTISNNPVIDGKYLRSSYLNLNASAKGTDTNSVPVMLGVNRDEGGVLAPFFHTTNLTTGIDDMAASLKLSANAIISSGAFPLGMGSNMTLRVFNTTTRIYTDNSFHCSSQYTAYAGVKFGVLPDIWYFEFNRTYQDPGYNMNGVCLPPVTPSHPFGDPSLEYYKCHAGDLANTFGNVARGGFPARDENDMPFSQLCLDYWTAFGRNLNPNPDPEYLRVRGYWNTLNQISFSGPWKPVDASNPEMLELQWNSVMKPFPDAKQCDVIGQPLDHLFE
ncbi:cholinesterase [Rhizodiscina lignyota]|uniref:Carboxylic ester hydrolase n=1 Tax=Rhizodiscina lignyota TaxID=1504668 RepID=A0A9P4IJD8_9PEZI|nr:cholinesterase [Rhizodiscina lignyota]